MAITRLNKFIMDIFININIITLVPAKNGKKRLQQQRSMCRTEIICLAA